LSGKGKNKSFVLHANIDPYVAPPATLSHKPILQKFKYKPPASTRTRNLEPWLVSSETRLLLQRFWVILQFNVVNSQAIYKLYTAVKNKVKT